MSGEARASDLLLLVSGFVVWSIAFTAIYTAFSVGCWLGWGGVMAGPLSMQALIVGAIWIAFIILGVLNAVLAWRRAAVDLRPVAGMLRVALPAANIAAVAATVVTGLPLLLTTSCI
jgi:hypothetical protein